MTILVESGRVETSTIIPGVILSVDNRSEKAILIIGQQHIKFDWNYDAHYIFRDLDNADPVELLATIAQCEKYSPFE